MTKTLSAMQSGQYDFTSAIGVFIAIGPMLIDSLLTDADAPSIPPWARWALRIVGVLIAAQGKPLVVRGQPSGVEEPQA